MHGHMHHMHHGLYGGGQRAHVGRIEKPLIMPRYIPPSEMRMFATAPTKVQPPAVIYPQSKDWSANPLRPRSLAEMVGQEKLKPIWRLLIDSAKASGRPMGHALFTGAPGTGKTTFASVIAQECGVDWFELKAPISLDMLCALACAARDGDLVFVDEIHTITKGDRREHTTSVDPENLYRLLEDGVCQLPLDAELRFPDLPIGADEHGVKHVVFPQLTWLAATTDPGRLPQPLLDRFTYQPVLEPYTSSEMDTIVLRNLKALGVKWEADLEAVYLFSNASRGIPRMGNKYVRAANDLAADHLLTYTLAKLVVNDLNSTTDDGLTGRMQTILTFLYQRCERWSKTSGRVHQASLNLLATACGTDTKSIVFSEEPWLVRSGLLEVRPGGRTLTPAGETRARQLLA